MARVPTTMFTACVALGIRSARPFPRALRRSTLTMQSSRHSFDALGAGDFPPIPEGLQLKSMAVVSRHGDRAPIARTLGTVIKTLDEEDFWRARLPPAESLAAWDALHPLDAPHDAIPMDEGEDVLAQLTLRGADECRQVGVMLRKHIVEHAGLLAPQLDPAAVYARSTNSRRTKQSLQNVLLGLYPEDKRDPRRKELVVLESRNRGDSMVPNGDKSCPRIPEIIADLRKNGYPGKQLPRHESIALNTARTLGYPRDGVRWSEAREVLACYEAHGLPLPRSVSTMFISDVSDYTAWMWSKWFSDPEAGRLSIGRLVEECIQKLDGALQDSSEPKLSLFSGHDSTLVPLLAVLGVYDGAWPGYSSFVSFEVAEGPDGKVLARVVYNNEAQALSGIAKEDPGHWVSWEDLKAGLQKWIPSKYERECRACGRGAERDLAALELASTLGGSDKP